MPRHTLRTILAAVALATAASSAIARDILVTGPGERVVDRTEFGAEVVEYTAALPVNVRDLDLASAAGWNAMENRLATASRAACGAIDDRIPVNLRQGRRDCEKSAYRGAIARVRASLNSSD